MTTPECMIDGSPSHLRIFTADWSQGLRLKSDSIGVLDVSREAGGELNWKEREFTGANMTYDGLSTLLSYRIPASDRVAIRELTELRKGDWVFILIDSTGVAWLTGAEAPARLTSAQSDTLQPNVTLEFRAGRSYRLSKGYTERLRPAPPCAEYYCEEALTSTVPLSVVWECVWSEFVC